MTYPIQLLLSNKECLVVGGGKIATRKVKNLINGGGKVTVISPTFTKMLINLKNKNKVKLIKDKFKLKYLKNKFLVIAATDNKKLNEFICKKAKKIHILSNNVSLKKYNDFFDMSVIRKKGITITISSDGKKIKKVKEIKNRILRVI